MKNSRIVLLACAFVACSQEHQQEGRTGHVRQAASATPTLVTIDVNGQFDDWQQVLLNPLQVSNDGNGIAGGGCYPGNPDRDCEGFTTQRDISTFAWTYDSTNIYTFIRRPASASTLTYSFIMDVDADGLAETTDFVMQVRWQNGGRTVKVELYRYAPAVVGGDPLSCPNTAACIAAGNPHALIGYIDGYDLPGTTGALVWTPPAPVPACTGSAAGDECGGDGLGTSGSRFEVFVPWAQLGVANAAPILWHVAASQNTNFNSAEDNVGGPDGQTGTFGVFGVDFTPDYLGSANSPGSVDYCHDVTNTGNFQDRYNLKALSNTGSSITFFRGCVTPVQIAVDANGDGDFLDVGDSVSAGGDTNADGLPDTDLVAANGVQKILIRVTTPTGISGSTDVTTATARSVTRPALVFDDVTDRTRIGPVTVLPDISLTGTPGATVDFGPHTVQNNQATADTFNLFVRSANGYKVELFADAAGLKGALLATDTNGDGTWDGATPQTASLATGGQAKYWISVAIPAGTPINTVDSTRLTATSSTTPTATGSALDILRVLNALTIAPSYTAPNGQLFGPAGSVVYLPHTIINSLSTSNTVSLTQTGTLAAGYTIRWWTDPNGDGNIADGVVIGTGPGPTPTFSLAAFGGTAHIVTEVGIPASGTPASTAAATTVTGISSSTATANDHVAVGNLQTYEDALFARPTWYFPACATIYARAVALTPLQATLYQLRFNNPLGTQISNNNLPTDSNGVGTGSYTLLSTDGPGNWRVRVMQTATQIYDLNPVGVESAGTVIATAPAVAVSGNAVPVSAQLNSTAVQSDYTGTTVTFEIRDPSSAVIETTTVNVIDVPFGSSTIAFALFPSVTYPVFGNYTMNAIWKTSCGTTIATGSATIASAPPAPTLLTPANGSVVGTSTPALTGTAEAGATVNVTVDGALEGTAPGAAFSLTTSTLSQGLHTWSATQTVSGATGPASGNFTFTVDTVAPLAPVVQLPANGTRTNDTTPTISGTAEANSSVAVFVGATQVGTVTATGGAWTYTLTGPQALAPGTYAATARATDAGGNVSAVSNSNSFTVDTTAPAAPVVVNPANGSISNDTTPTVNGTAEANSTVAVFIDAGLVGTVTADAVGNWSYTLTAGQALTAATHAATARATDVAGNIGVLSAANNFTVDLTAPSAAVVVTPANGSRTNDTTPTISGTSDANDSVAVFINGVLRGTVTASPGGLWTYTLTAGQALAEGTYSATAQATDPANNVGPLSAANNFTVDTTAPLAPSVLQPANLSRTNDTTPTVSGTAEANASVAVFVGATQVGTVTADSSGNWSYTLTAGQALVAGAYAATATATDIAGNTGPTSTANNFTVDLTPPAAPTITTPANGSRTQDGTPTISGTAEANATVAVFIDAVLVGTVTANSFGNWTYTLTAGQALVEGTYAATARATDVAGNLGPLSAANSFTVDTTPPAAPVVVSPANLSRTNDSTPTVSGTAEANATVQVFINATQVGSVTADGSGNWTYTLSAGQALAEGTWAATAVAIDQAGNASVASAANNFTVDLTAPAAPAVAVPVNGTITNDVTPTIAGTAEANTTVRVFLNGVQVGVVLADGSGSWSYSLTAGQALPAGTYAATATATDAAGNTSPSSTANNFTVDLTAPVAPVIATPADGSRTNVASPTVSGTTEANASVAVFVDATLVGTVAADGSGNWTYTLTPSQALLEGGHAATARATDLAGNTGPTSAANNFTVDLTAPVAPIVVAPADGSRTNNSTPTVSGTAEASSSVAVFIGATQVGTVTAAGGNWTYTLTALQALAEGPYTASARATDVAGNTGPLSAANTFTVDTTAPPAPVVLLPTNGSRTNDTTPTISGTAEANASVAVFIGASQVGTVTAVAGNWTYTLTAPQALAEGTYSATARATDAAGNNSGLSNSSSFTVDTSAPAAPVVINPADGSISNDSTPTVTGTAEVNAQVAIFIGATLVGTVGTDVVGNWTYTLTAGQALADGTYSASARATDVAGNTGAPSAGNSFTIDSTAPNAAVVVIPANGSRTNDTTPTVSGTADPLNTVAVFIDGAQVGSVTASVGGAWTYTLTAGQALSQGTYSATAQATNLANTTGPMSAINSFTVDTTAPAAPIVVLPADGSRTNNTQPTISGTAEAGATVAVFVAATQVGTATADSSGAWSYTLTAGQALAAGVYAATAIATDIAGNTGPTSAANSFTIDLTAPAAPVVVAPADGSRTNDTTPTVTGTAEANASVGVFIDASLVGTVAADSAGSWTYTLTSGQLLAEGSHAATAQATDVAGNLGSVSTANNFTVDTTAPAAPVITSPATGGLTNDTTPTISGTAEANSTVKIFVGVTQVGTVTADGSGNWTYTLTAGQALPDGSYTVTATATDVAGNTSAASTGVPFTVDATPPAAPIIAAPVNGSITNDNTPTVSGTAEAGSTVAVFVGAVQVGTVTADINGIWSYTLTAGQALADATYATTARATDAAGNLSPTSTAVNFTVDTALPAAPVILVPLNDSRTNDTTPTLSGTAEANSTVNVFIGAVLVGTVTADAQGNWTYTLTPGQALAENTYFATATATDSANNTSPLSSSVTFVIDLTPPAAPVVATPANGAVIGDNTPTITGTAEADSSVAVSVDGAVVGTVTADAQGNWSYTLTSSQGLANGSHSAQAVATDRAGNASANSNTNTFTVDATVPAAPVVTVPADGSLTNDDTPSVGGTAEPGTTVQVTVDGVVVASVTTDGQGRWSYTLSDAQKLTDGSHAVSAVATDAAGNASPQSSVVTFTVDATPPPAPTLSSPTAGANTTANPPITGKAEPNSTVKVYVDGKLVGTVTADGAGDWSFTPTTALADGSHIITASATDAAGNTGPTSSGVDITVGELDGGAGGGQGGGAGGGSGGGGEPPVFGYRGGGCGCGATDASATLAFGLLSLLFTRARRRRANLR